MVVKSRGVRTAEIGAAAPADLGRSARVVAANYERMEAGWRAGQEIARRVREQTGSTRTAAER
jgi:hypothetical protein